MQTKTKPKNKMDKARAEFEKVWGMEIEPRLRYMGLLYAECIEIQTVLWNHWKARKR